MNTKEKPVVFHSVFSWLPLTMRWVYNQLKHMNAFESIVLAEITQNLDQFPWKPIYFMRNKYAYFAFRALRKLRIISYPAIYDRAIKRHEPLILHSHFADRGWHDLPIVRKYRLKHVVTFYGYDVNMLPTQKPIWKERYKELFDKADLFLCEGPHMAKCVVSLGCSKEKVKVQRFGVEVDKIPFAPRKIEDNGILKILIAGTFREKKGIPYALEAIGMLKNKYPNIRVTVIGDSTGQKREEKEKKKILDIIKKYNLEPITRMLGFQPYSVLMEEAYKHHIFLSPSVTASDGDTEGGAPVTIIEMAASGMPVVSTWHCDVPEVIIDNISGFLVKERDPEALCNRLMMIVDNPLLLQEMGSKARKYVAERFNQRNLLSQQEKLYMRLLSEK